MASRQTITHDVIDKALSKKARPTLRLMTSNKENKRQLLELSLEKITQNNPKVVNLLEQMTLLAKALAICYSNRQNIDNLCKKDKLIIALLDSYQKIKPVVQSLSDVEQSDIDRVISHIDKQIDNLNDELKQTYNELSQVLDTK